VLEECEYVRTVIVQYLEGYAECTVTATQHTFGSGSPVVSTFNPTPARVAKLVGCSAAAVGTSSYHLINHNAAELRHAGIKRHAVSSQLEISLNPVAPLTLERRIVLTDQSSDAIAARRACTSCRTRHLHSSRLPHRTGCEQQRQ
jgi:hypothetical protein